MMVMWLQLGGSLAAFVAIAFATPALLERVALALRDRFEPLRYYPCTVEWSPMVPVHVADWLSGMFKRPASCSPGKPLAVACRSSRCKAKPFGSPVD